MEESIASEQGKTQGKDVADVLMLVRNISPTPCCQHRSMLFIEHHDDRRPTEPTEARRRRHDEEGTERHHTTSTEQTDRAPVQRRTA